MIDTGKPNAVAETATHDDTAVARAYAALRSATMLLDRGDRARATLAGASAATVLTGLVTNDVLALSRGQGQYAALLTPKGKVIADVRIFARESDLLLDTPARAAAGFWATVRKFINPRLARYADVSQETGDLALFGPGARRLVATLLGADDAALTDLAPYGHRQVTAAGAPVLVARTPDAGVDGFELFAALETLQRLRREAVALGAVEGSEAAFDVARIEAGRPAWGIDMDENTLAQEAILDSLHAISFTKGCYTGQETVARVHFRGHVNRYLRGIRFDRANPPPSGAELVDAAADRAVGDVRSVAISPRLGGIALAMVRREVEDGAWLTARWDGGLARASVVPLPFTS